MKNGTQEIYINLDDSGKLTTKEQISVYGGVVFLSKKEKDKFITQYRSIMSTIKCGYCQDSGKSYVVQAADLLAGTIRRKSLHNKVNIHQELSKFVDFKIILP